MRPVHLYGEKCFFSVTARYVIYMLKLQGHYASFDKFYNLSVWIVLASLYSKVRAIFAIRPVHLYWEKCFFSVAARYIVYMLKLQGHYASFDKFYNLNVWHRFIEKLWQFFLFSLYICMGRNLFSVLLLGMSFIR